MAALTAAEDAEVLRGVLLSEEEKAECQSSDIRAAESEILYNFQRKSMLTKVVSIFLNWFCHRQQLD